MINQTMNTEDMTTLPPAEGHPCKGAHGDFNHPENRYHPAQVAYLMSIKRYTGRLIVDVAYLPEDLKFL